MADGIFTEEQRATLGLNPRVEIPVQAQEAATVNAGASSIDRRKLDVRLATDPASDAEAKALIKLHISQQLNVDHTAFSYETLFSNYFKEGSNPDKPMEAYSILQQTAKKRIEPDEYDRFAGMDFNAKLVEAQKKIGERDDTDDKDLTAPEAQGDESKKRLVDIYERRLRNGSKNEWLRYIDTELNKLPEPNRMRQFAYRSLMKEEINMVEYNSLSAPERAFFADYLMLANPDRAITMLENVGVSFKNGFHDVTGSIGKTIDMATKESGYMSFNDKYVYSTMSSINDNWAEMFDDKGQWKDYGQRESYVRMVGEKRYNSWLMDTMAATPQGEEVQDIGRDKATLAKQRSFFIRDTREQMDNIYTKVRAGELTVSEEKEAYKIRQLVRKRYDMGEGVKGFVNKRVSEVIPMAMDLSAVAVLGRVNPNLALAYSAVRFQGDFAEQLEYKYGFSQDESIRWAVVASVPYSLVETLQGKQIEKGFAIGFKGLFSKSYRKAIDKSMMEVFKSAGKDYAKDTIMEIGEEGLQKAMEIAVVSAMEETYQKGNVDERALIDEFKEEMIAAALSMPLLTGGARVGGAGLNVATDFSKTKSLRGMLDKWSVEAVEGKVREQNRESRMNIKDELALVRAEDMELYNNAKTEKDRINILDNAGVSNPIEADAVLQGDFDRLQDIADERRARELINIGVEQSSADEKRSEDIRIAMEQAGVRREFVNIISSSMDTSHVGAYDNINSLIQVVQSVDNPDAVFNHEVFHFLKDAGYISTKDWSTLQQAVQKPEYRRLNLKYSDFIGDAKVEEVAADAFGVWTPQERSAFKKVVDFVRDVFNLSQTEQDVFRRLDDTLMQMAKDGRERGLTGEMTDMTQAPVTLKPQGVKFARADSASQTIDDAARSYALASVDGRNARSVAERIADNSDLTVEEIESAGKVLLEESDATLQDGASRIERRVAVRTESQRKTIMAQLKAARKAGAKMAEEQAKAQEKAKRTATTKGKREERYKSPLKMVVSDAELLGAILANDASGVMATVRTAVDKQIEAKGIERQDVKDSLYKHTLANALWQSVRRMSFDRSRQAAQTELAKLRDDATEMEHADRIAIDLVSRMHRIDSLAKEQSLAKIIKGIFKTGIGKKPASTTLNVDRTFTAEDHAEFLVIRQAFGKSKDSVDAIIATIAPVMDDNPEMGVEDAEKVEGIVRKVEKFLPGLRAMDDLEPMDKLKYAQSVLQSWGGLEHASLQELAEAAVLLEMSVEEAKGVQLAALKEQSSKMRRATGYGRLATDNKSGKKAIITVSPTFNTIDQRMEELGNFSSKRGKEAMQRLIDLIGIQQAAMDQDALMDRWSNEVADIIKSSYGVIMLDKIIIKLNSKRSAYEKYSPPNSKVKEPMSKSQLMQIWVSWRQDSYKSNLRGMGYNQEIIDSIEKELSDGDIGFINGLTDMYSNIGNMMDEVSMRIWGQRVANQDLFYMPVVTDWASEWGGADIRALPVAPPSYNKRVPSSRALDTSVGITEMLDSRLAQHAHFISHAESHILARAAFGDEKVVRSVEETFGKSGVWRGLKDHLTDIYSDGGSDGFRSEWLRKAVNAFSLRALSGNLKLPFSQQASLPSYALHYGSLRFSKLVAAGALNPESYVAGLKAIWNSPQFASRVKLGGTEFMRSAMMERFGVSSLDAIPVEQARDVAKFVASMIKKAYRYGMITNKVGDVIPILTVGPAIYMEELRRSGDERVAMNRTWKAIHGTQQSYATKDRSALSRRGGIVAKLLTMFTTTPGQYLSYQSAATRALVAKIQTDGVSALKSKEAGKLLDVLAINHIVLPGVYSVISTVFSNFIRDDEWDDDDTKDLMIAMAMGPFSAWAIFAGLGEDFLDEALNGESSVFGGLLPIEGLRQDAKLTGAVIRNLIDGDFDEMLENVDKELKNIVTPYRQISDAMENR